MNYAQYVRILSLATEITRGTDRLRYPGDWDLAFREAGRRSDRASQILLLRARRPQDGYRPTIPETNQSSSAPEYRGVRLCWNDRIAEYFALDIAEHVLAVWESHSDNRSPHLALRAKRQFLDGDLSESSMLDATEDVWRLWHNDFTQEERFSHAGQAVQSAAYASGRMYRSASLAADRAVNAAGAGSFDSDGNPDRLATRYSPEREAMWQRTRLLGYLFGDVIPCWEES